MLTKNCRYFFFSIFILSGLIGYSQNGQEYLGVIKLNDSSFISYKLNLLEKYGIISGYSITDMGGEHETKSTLTGTYHKASNKLAFKEVGIVYTKSEVSDYDFCYVHFNGELRNLNSTRNLKGAFNGRYSDGTTCIDGEIIMKNTVKIERKASRIDKVIKKSKKIPEEIKATTSISKTLDSLNMNILKADQKMNMFSASDFIKLKIYDAGKVDGDKINILINDTMVIKNYVVSKDIKEIIVPLRTQKTTIKIRALNTGTISPNTAKIEFIDSSYKIEAITSLKYGEKTSITVHKK